MWREAGLSGTGQRAVGPLFEIHDATSGSGKAALFGFVGIPATQRNRLGQDAIVAASVHQLARIFGPKASAPQATLYKDWAADPLTATAWDAQAGEHPESGALAPVMGDWRNRLWLAGSEAARQDAGYLAGAIHAAEHEVSMIMNQLKSAP